MAVFVLHLSVVLASCASVVLQFTFIVFSMSMSGMPNKAYLFLELQRIHHFCLLWWFIFTLHIPNCVIVLLYVFNWTFLFLVAPNYSFVAWNNLLYICKGMFPSLVLSTLYGIVIQTLFDDVFKICCYYQIFGIENNRIYIHCVNMITFFMVLVLLLL